MAKFKLKLVLALGAALLTIKLLLLLAPLPPAPAPALAPASGVFPVIANGSALAEHAGYDHTIPNPPSAPPLISPQQSKSSIPTNQHLGGPISWKDFLQLPKDPTPIENNEISDKYQSLIKEVPFKACSEDVEKKLSSLMLSKEDFDWCQWAIREGKFIYLYYRHAYYLIMFCIRRGNRREIVGKTTIC
jgi:hypothetical protein